MESLVLVKSKPTKNPFFLLRSHHCHFKLVDVGVAYLVDLFLPVSDASHP